MVLFWTYQEKNYSKHNPHQFKKYQVLSWPMFNLLDFWRAFRVPKHFPTRKLNATSIISEKTSKVCLIRNWQQTSKQTYACCNLCALIVGILRLKASKSTPVSASAFRSAKMAKICKDLPASAVLGYAWFHFHIQASSGAQFLGVRLNFSSWSIHKPHVSISTSRHPACCPCGFHCTLSRFKNWHLDLVAKERRVSEHAASNCKWRMQIHCI